MCGTPSKAVQPPNSISNIVFYMNSADYGNSTPELSKMMTLILLYGAMSFVPLNDSLFIVYIYFSCYEHDFACLLNIYARASLGFLTGSRIS